MSAYHSEWWLGQVPADPLTPASTTVASASAGIPVPSGPPCEFAYPV